MLQRLLLTVCLLLATLLARADRILLVPLDSRPAAGQYAQMISKMDGIEVKMPPPQALGRFKTPGSPEASLNWLKEQDYGDVTAVILSSDMLAYGGLIASRTDEITYERAVSRLDTLAQIRAEHPNVPFYVFSATMRLAPTATISAAPWRLQLAKYGELIDKMHRNYAPEDKREMSKILNQIPAVELQRYIKVRERNHNIQLYLLGQTAKGVYDYIIIGQDDAKPFGMHVPETNRLREKASSLDILTKVYFCEGIDQHSNILISRALLKHSSWVPRVRIMYSDEALKTTVASYESKPIEQSLSDQLLASGARPMPPNGEYDYTLYLNVPNRRKETFDTFVENLLNDLDSGFPIAVADINFGRDGTCDTDLFKALWKDGKVMGLLSYAGWNTAGNSMGTAIPAANVYLLARRDGVNAYEREVAQREFLLHRLTNDIAYHKFTRPEAYKRIAEMPNGHKEEFYGNYFNQINEFVQHDLKKYLEAYFQQQFYNRKFYVGGDQYRFTGLSDVHIYLPWPRAYEVRLEFKMDTEPLKAGTPF